MDQLHPMLWHAVMDASGGFGGEDVVGWDESILTDPLACE